MEAKFTTGSTMRHVVVMTVTASAGLLSLFLVDALNLFYISMLGVTELAAAIGFAGTIQFFMISVSIGLLIAGTATISRAIGAGESARARELAGSSIVTAFLMMSALAAVLWIYREDALRLLGAKDEALEQASFFLAIALPSVPLIGIGMSCSGTLRAMGEAQQAMYVTLGGGAIAAVLDPILIFALDLGLTGAAIALALTRLGIAAIGLWLLIVRHKMVARPSLPIWLRDIRPLAKIAGPAMATQLSTPFGNAYLTTIVADFGDDAVAGWAVIGRMTALAFGGIFALAGAVGPIIGQNYGAKIWPRIAMTYRDALIFAAIYVVVAWAALAALTPFIIDGFGLVGAGAEIVSTFMTYAAGAFVFTGALFTSNAAFNNLGRPLWSTLFNWSRDAGVIPLLALALGGSLGVAGAIWIQALAGVIVGTVAVIVGWRCVRKIASRDLPPAIAASVDVPAFASGRIAPNLAPAVLDTPDDRSRPQPLASADKNR
ncbi:MAG: MATE family efflux transporter [Pseudomonadota bacterium]